MDAIKIDDGFFQALGFHPKVKSAVTVAAERIAHTARGTAPVLTGEYRNSIKVVTPPRQSRFVAHVRADASHALVVEAQSQVLQRAARANGKGS